MVSLSNHEVVAPRLHSLTPWFDRRTHEVSCVFGIVPNILSIPASFPRKRESHLIAQ